MRQKKPSKDNSERWLLTYSDLITLLMVLFVLLYAMSNVNTEKYKQLAVSLGSAFGGSTGILQNTAAISESEGKNNPGGANGDATKQTNAVTQGNAGNAGDTGDAGGVQLEQRITEQSDMQKLKEYIDEVLTQNNLSSVVSTSVQVTGLVISFPSSVFFDSGADVLKDDMKKSLSQITVILNKIDNSILVEGNTDNVPIKMGSKYSSNWQLSALRAANVVQYLVESGNVNGARLSAIGYGENHPVADNATLEGRNKNRRIELAILYDSKEDTQKATQQKVQDQKTDQKTTQPKATTQPKTTTEKAIEQANH